MTPDALREAVLAILGTIAPEIRPEDVRPDADLRDELDLDSMDFLRFAVQLEQRLGVSVPEADYPRVRTLDGCVAYLAERGAREQVEPPAPEASDEDPWGCEWLTGGSEEEEPAPAAAAPPPGASPR